MQFRPVQHEGLRPDCANIATVKMYVVRSELAGARAQQVRTLILDRMIGAAQQGCGVPQNSLPVPLRQHGLECQTFALLNGIQAVAGIESIRGLAANPGGIRTLAIGKSQAIDLLSQSSIGASDNDAQHMAAVAMVLMEDGIIASRAFISGTNPIQTTRRLFSQKTFMGCSKGSEFHAYAIVPLASPTEDRFVIKIDSLGGKMDVMTAPQFLHALVNLEPADDFEIFTVR